MKDRIHFASHGRGEETLANASIEIFKDSVAATLDTGGILGLLMATVGDWAT